jgi:tRNA (cmo5U34)-methyltransferase
VERFSNLETGQQTIIDAPLMMDLLAHAAVKTTPHAKRLLDIGCGAGNNTIKTVRIFNGLDCDLVDLSPPMLEKARERISKEKSGKIRLLQGDVREIELGTDRYDIVLAAAVLHSPLLGEYTDGILRDQLGFSPEQIQQLREKGAV